MRHEPSGANGHFARSGRRGEKIINHLHEHGPQNDGFVNRLETFYVLCPMSYVLFGHGLLPVLLL